MVLTYKKIMDYFRCPLLYYFKHEAKMGREEKDSVLYQDKLRSVAMFYYYNLMNGVKPRKEVVQDKWQKTWDDFPDTVEDILFRESNPNRTRKRNYTTDGIKALNDFYDMEVELDFLPIVVNTEVSLRLGDYILRDNIDLIREVNQDGDRELEILRITNTSVKSKNYKLTKDILATFQTMAFRKLFEAKEDYTTIYNLYHGTKYVINYNDNDFKRLETTVQGVGKSIDNKVFYPIVSHQCTSCQYLDVCEKYKY